MSSFSGAAVAGAHVVLSAGDAHGSPTYLASAALAGALADCGLGRESIDGLAVQIGSPRGSDYDVVARLCGLRVRWASQTWSHGRFTATVLQHAAMAVNAGLANCVVCLAVYRNSAFGRHGTATYPAFSEAMREGDGPHGEVPAIGLMAPMAGAAFATRRYLERYKVDRGKLGNVAIALRAHAAKNPIAIFRQPIDELDYEASPYVVEPLRRLDCSVPVDMGAAVVICAAERAKDLRQPPVYILGAQGIPAGPDEYIFGQPGLAIHQAREFEYRPAGRASHVFITSGLDISDVGAFYCYDAFTPLVLWSLERFGYCPVGEAADWLEREGIGPGGKLPVNTNGGMLSEGHTNGWGHTVEIVRQLRGECGDRQLPGLEVAQWATALGDSIIYARHGL